MHRATRPSHALGCAGPGRVGRDDMVPPTGPICRNASGWSGLTDLVAPSTLVRDARFWGVCGLFPVHGLAGFARPLTPSASWWGRPTTANLSCWPSWPCPCRPPGSVSDEPAVVQIAQLIRMGRRGPLCRTCAHSSAHAIPHRPRRLPAFPAGRRWDRSSRPPGSVPDERPGKPDCPY